jgi:hypothetical protein
VRVNACESQGREIQKPTPHTHTHTLPHRPTLSLFSLPAGWGKKRGKPSSASGSFLAGSGLSMRLPDSLTSAEAAAAAGPPPKRARAFLRAFPESVRKKQHLLSFPPSHPPSLTHVRSLYCSLPFSLRSSLHPFCSVGWTLHNKHSSPLLPAGRPEPPPRSASVRAPGGLQPRNPPGPLPHGAVWAPGLFLGGCTRRGGGGGQVEGGGIPPRAREGAFAMLQLRRHWVRSMREGL